jgi:hypothetical protein
VAVAVEAHRGDDRQTCGGGRDECSLQLLERRHSLDPQHVDATFDQAGHLLGERRLRFGDREQTVRLEQGARGADAAGNDHGPLYRFGCPPGDPGRRSVELTSAIGRLVEFEAGTVAAEGIREDDVGAGVDIAAVHRLDQRWIGDVE